ncbi:MAG: HEAT repeat domain-containing protein [Oscillatoriales cyanobacterium RM2_1_1]|nr:HEAT repeat domain-containing protein [Oscillatoriales cyanobacterium SM2_3_0]NJO45747.1 HEAT repeat domain-containing protein [Oscillatoriales cyanobacterium RM2_1_1]
MQPEIQPGDDPILLNQHQTDALLQQVRGQLEAQTFDDTDQATLKQLVEGFADARGMVRLALAETLGSIGRSTTSVLLEGLTHHPNPVVRRACAKTLTLTADPGAIPTLVQALLNDPDTVVQGSTVGAMARIGKAAVPPLLGILETPGHSESIKGHVTWALAFMGAEVKEELYQAFSSDSDEVRAAVLGAITNIVQSHPEEKFLQLLTQALGDPVPDIQNQAAMVLGDLNYRPAIPQLIQLLQSRRNESRKSAALALMKLGDPMALESLRISLSQEPEPQIQSVMQLAISQLERQVSV